MVKTFTLVFLLLISSVSFAQQTNEELLLEKLAVETIDSLKADIYTDLHNEVFKTNLDKAKEYANGILKYGLLAHRWGRVMTGYLALARCERKLRTYQTVLPYDFKALEAAEKLNNANQIFLCTSQIANDYLDAQMEKEAVKYMLLAQVAAIKTKSFVSIGKSYETIGYYYYQHNNPSQAIPYLREAVNNSLKGLDLYRANRSRTWLGFCMMQLNQTKGLLEIAFEALDYFKKANLITSQAECYRLLGFCNLNNGDYVHALTNYSIAKEIYEKTDNRLEQANVSIDLGRNYIHLKDYEKAKKNIEEAEKIFVSNNYEPGIIDCQTLWGQYYSANKQYELADQFFIKANNLLKKNPKQDLLIINEISWAKNAYLQKNIKKGDLLTHDYTYLKKDSTTRADIVNNLLRIETQYQTRAKSDSLKFERQNAAIAKEELKNKNTWLLGTSAFVLLLIVGFMLQRKYRLQAEADKKQIELLNNEIHHRVKNNLAVIHRLISVAEMASMGTIPLVSLKNRINTIGLLHQHLYQDKLFDAVDMQLYLTELVALIKDTFETDKNVDVNIDTLIVLSATTVDKIGLIVNELITNSFKYAFNGQEKGSIKIAAKKSTAGSCQLIVSDNGPGIDTKNNQNNYGMKLIAGLCHELRGTFNFKNDHGTQFELNFTDSANR